LVGFGMKWMMGWMHDTLEYFQKIRCIESTIKMN
jgi:1,4-alpha-glucan branching enzyme